MRDEIEAASNFLLHFLLGDKPLSDAQSQAFHRAVRLELTQKCTQSWHLEHPEWGSAFRAVILRPGVAVALDSADSVIGSGLNAVMQASCPAEADSLRERIGQAFGGPKSQPMILWIDPHSVCYRLGDRGTIRYIYQAAWAQSSSLGKSTGKVMPIY